MKHANVAIFIPHVGCPHTCIFCNQRAISGSQHEPTADEVVRTVLKAKSDLGQRIKDSEIAFFGGSFTAIDRSYMIELLEAAGEFIGEDGFAGIRISTRPDAINEEILDILKRYGVSSIELGVQSMNDATLLLNERGHTSDDVVEASNLIKRFGFSLGHQMMVGMYGDSEDDIFKTADRIISLAPDTVRIYPTVALKNTELSELFKQGKYVPISIEKAVMISSRLLKMFEESGISVIRLGLHAGEGLERDIVAGPYHPAFRELCESELFFDSAKRSLIESGIECGDAVLFVNPKNISKMIGHNKYNIEKFKKIGYNIKVKENIQLLNDEVLAQRPSN